MTLPVNWRVPFSDEAYKKDALLTLRRCFYNLEEMYEQISRNVPSSMTTESSVLSVADEAAVLAYPDAEQKMMLWAESEATLHICVSVP